MKRNWSRSTKALVAVSALALGGLLAFRAITSARDARMRLDHEHKPLVVFVIIDALRRDHVGALGYDRATTPNLDRLVNEGFVASGTLAQASQTAPSVASIFTSTAPHVHGVQFDLRTRGFGNKGRSKAPLLAERNLTLAEVLSQAGYFTAGAVANPWLRKKFGYSQGFDHYIALPCHKRGRGICDGARINQEATKIIRAHPAEKTFLYLHYMDVHNPYAHAGKLPRVFRKGPGHVVYKNGLAPGVSKDEVAYSIDAYDDGLLYTDRLIGKLVTEIEAAAAARDVLLVITSDHGDEFLEHGGLGHGSTLYPELIETFAIFWRPDGRMSRSPVQRPSRSMDIAPTILDLVRTQKPPEMAGNSLLEPVPDEAIVSELARKKAAIKDGWGLIRDLDSSEEELVAYSAGHGAAPSPRLVEELRSLLDSLRVRETPINTKVPDSAVVQQLKALGYVE